MEIKPTIRVKQIIKRNSITTIEDAEILAVSYCGGSKLIDDIIMEMKKNDKTNE